MNGIAPKAEITQDNIEEMCFLAEDIVHQLNMSFRDYDESGNDIFDKHFRSDCDFEKDILPLIRRERMDMDELPESHLLYDLFRRGDDIGDVRYYTLEEIRPWIQRIIPKAIQMFRKGTSDCGEMPYKVADSVSDDYLAAIFAREVRNMMMIFAGQRMQATNARRYLLLLEWPEIHDADEWKGIYFDDENLKKAYDELVFELEEDKAKSSYNGLRVAIWEFWPEQEQEDTPVTHRSLRPRQKIRPVKPEELSCFKKADSRDKKETVN